MTKKKGAATAASSVPAAIHWTAEEIDREILALRLTKEQSKSPEMVKTIDDLVNKFGWVATPRRCGGIFLESPELVPLRAFVTNIEDRKIIKKNSVKREERSAMISQLQRAVSDMVRVRKSLMEQLQTGGRKA